MWSTARVAITPLLLLAVAAAAPESSTLARAHAPETCARLTVTIATVAKIPSGVSVRALQEGRIYPPRCR